MKLFATIRSCSLSCAVDDIESAMRLSGDEFKSKYNFSKPSPAGPPVITYCRAGVRAETAAKIFADQLGFPRFVGCTVSWIS